MGCSTPAPGCTTRRRAGFSNRTRYRFAAGDANLYRYAFNAPTVYRDPSGLTAAVGYAVMSTVLKFVGDVDVKVCVSDESTRIVFTASLGVGGWGVWATKGFIADSRQSPDA